MKKAKKLESLKNDVTFDSTEIKAEVKGSGWICGGTVLVIGPNGGVYVGTYIFGEQAWKGAVVKWQGVPIP